MKTVVIPEPFKVKIIETQIPEISPEEVLVKVSYAGICGTDIDIYKNEANFEVKYPHIAGHEWSGIVVKTGKQVKVLKPGDKVVGDCIVSCNKCPKCLYGDYSYCINAKSVGTSEPSIEGAFKEYMAMPERHLFKIPDNVSLLDASLAEPAAVAFRAIEKGRLCAGETVLVFGTGAIGFFAVQYARIMGAQTVVMAGRNDKKLEIAGKHSGADYVINIKKENLFESLKGKFNCNGPDLIVEASGNIEALHDTVRAIDYYGRITVPGSYPVEWEKMNLAMMSEKEISLIFANGVGGAQTFCKILNFMSSGRLNTRGLITEILELEDFKKAIDLKLVSSDSIKTIIRIDKDTKE